MPKKPKGTKTVEHKMRTPWLKNAMKSIGTTAASAFKETYPNISEVGEVGIQTSRSVVHTLRKIRPGSKRVTDNIKQNKYVQYANKAYKNALTDLKAGNLAGNADRQMSALMGGDEKDNDFGDLFDFDTKGSSSEVSFGDEDSPNTTNNINLKYVNAGATGEAVMEIRKGTQAQTKAILETNKATLDAMVALAGNSMMQTQQIGAEVITHLSNIESSLASMVQYNNENVSKYIEASMAYMEKMGGAGKNKESGNANTITGASVFNSTGGINVGAYKKLVKKQFKNVFENSSIGMLSMIDDQMLEMAVADPLGTASHLLGVWALPKILGGTMEQLEKAYSAFAPMMLNRLADWGDEVATDMFGHVKKVVGQTFGIRVDKDSKIKAAKVERGPIPFDGETKHAITEIITKELREQTSYLKAIAKKNGVDIVKAKGDADVWDYETNKFIRVDDARKKILNEVADALSDSFKSSEFGMQFRSQMMGKYEKEEDQQNIEKTLENILQVLTNTDKSINLYDRNAYGSAWQEAMNEVLKGASKEQQGPVKDLIKAVNGLINQMERSNPTAFMGFNRDFLVAKNKRNQKIKEIGRSPYEYNLFATGLNDVDLDPLIAAERGWYGVKGVGEGSATMEGPKAGRRQGWKFAERTVGRAANSAMGMMGAIATGNRAKLGKETKDFIFGIGKDLADTFGEAVVSPIKKAIFGDAADDKDKSITDLIADRVGSIKNAVMKKLFGDKESTEEKNRRGVLSKVTDRFRDGANKWINAFFGKEVNALDTEEGRKKLKDDATAKMKEIAPTAAAGTAIGTGVSLLAGHSVLGMFMGGPVGALMGLTGGLAMRSEKFQNYLFGEKDDNGERVGGIISKKTQKFAKENKGKLFAGAGLGALFSGSLAKMGGLMGTMVGGPITGALLGLGGAIVANSESFREVLFGSEKAGQKGLFKGVADAFNAHFRKNGRNLDADTNMAGVGALGGALTGAMISKLGLLGAFAGPAGPIGGALAGLALSIGMQGKTFKSFLFGETDEKGNHVLGLFEKMGNQISANVIKPVAHEVSFLVQDLGLWLKHDVAYPLTFAAEALAGVAGDITGAVIDKVNAITESVGGFLRDGFDAVFGGITRAVGNVVGATMNIVQKSIKATVGIPAKAVTLAIDYITSPFKKVADKAMELVSIVGGVIGGAINEVKNAALGVVKNVGKAAWGVISAPFKFVGSALKDGVGAVNNFLDKKLESRGIKITDYTGTDAQNDDFATRWKRQKEQRKAKRRELDKQRKRVRANDKNGKIIARYTGGRFDEDTQEAREWLKFNNSKAYEKLNLDVETSDAFKYKGGAKVDEDSSLIGKSGKDLSSTDPKKLDAAGKTAVFTSKISDAVDSILNVLQGKNADGTARGSGKDAQDAIQKHGEENGWSQDEIDDYKEAAAEGSGREGTMPKSHTGRLLMGWLRSARDYIFGSPSMDGPKGNIARRARDIGYGFKNRLKGYGNTIKGRFEKFTDFLRDDEDGGGDGRGRRRVGGGRGILGTILGGASNVLGGIGSAVGTGLSGIGSLFGHIANNAKNTKKSGRKGSAFAKSFTDFNTQHISDATKNKASSLRSTVTKLANDANIPIPTKVPSLSDGEANGHIVASLHGIWSEIRSHFAKPIDVNVENAGDATLGGGQTFSEANLAEAKDLGTTREEKEAQLAEEDKLRMDQEEHDAILETADTEKKQHSMFSDIFSKKGLLTGALLLAAPHIIKLVKWFVSGPGQTILSTVASTLSNIASAVGGFLTKSGDDAARTEKDHARKDGKSAGDVMVDEIENTKDAAKKAMDGNLPGAAATFVTDRDGDINSGTIPRARLLTKGAANFGASAITLFKKGKKAAKSGAKAARSILNKIGGKKAAEVAGKEAAEGAAKEGAEAVAKEGVAAGAKAAGVKVVDKAAENKSFIAKAIELIKKGFNFLKDKLVKTAATETAEGITEGVAAKAVSSAADDALRVVETAATRGDVAKKLGGRLASFFAATGTMASTVVILAAKEVTWVALGALNGITGAAKLFKIDKSKVDGLMRIISTVIGALEGTTAGTVIDIVNEVIAGITGIDFISNFACMLYNIISGEKKAKALKTNQDDFYKSYLKYLDDKVLKAYQQAIDDGTIPNSMTLEEYSQKVSDGEIVVKHKSFQDYNSDKNATVGERFIKGIGKAGKAIKNFFTGGSKKKEKNQTVTIDVSKIKPGKTITKKNKGITSTYTNLSGTTGGHGGGFGGGFASGTTLDFMADGPSDAAVTAYKKNKKKRKLTKDQLAAIQAYMEENPNGMMPDGISDAAVAAYKKNKKKRKIGKDQLKAIQNYMFDENGNYTAAARSALAGPTAGGAVIDGPGSASKDSDASAQALKDVGTSLSETAGKIATTAAQTALDVNEEKTKKDIKKIIRQVENGDWGVGEERIKKLAEAGYNYATIQNAVNKRAGVKKRYDEAKYEVKDKNTKGTSTKGKKNTSEFSDDVENDYVTTRPYAANVFPSELFDIEDRALDPLSKRNGPLPIIGNNATLPGSTTTSRGFKNPLASLGASIKNAWGKFDKWQQNRPLYTNDYTADALASVRQASVNNVGRGGNISSGVQGINLGNAPKNIPWSSIIGGYSNDYFADTANEAGRLGVNTAMTGPATSGVQGIAMTKAPKNIPWNKIIGGYTNDYFADSLAKARMMGANITMTGPATSGVQGIAMKNAPKNIPWNKIDQWQQNRPMYINDYATNAANAGRLRVNTAAMTGPATSGVQGIAMTKAPKNIPWSSVIGGYTNDYATDDTNEAGRLRANTAAMTGPATSGVQGIAMKNAPKNIPWDKIIGGYTNDDDIVSQMVAAKVNSSPFGKQLTAKEIAKLPPNIRTLYKNNFKADTAAATRAAKVNANPFGKQLTAAEIAALPREQRILYTNSLKADVLKSTGTARINANPFGNIKEQKLNDLKEVGRLGKKEIDDAKESVSDVKRRANAKYYSGLEKHYHNSKNPVDQAFGISAQRERKIQERQARDMRLYQQQRAEANAAKEGRSRYSRHDDDDDRSSRSSSRSRSSRRSHSAYSERRSSYSSSEASHERNDPRRSSSRSSSSRSSSSSSSSRSRSRSHSVSRSVRKVTRSVGRKVKSVGKSIANKAKSLLRKLRGGHGGGFGGFGPELEGPLNEQDSVIEQNSAVFGIDPTLSNDTKKMDKFDKPMNARIERNSTALSKRASEAFIKSQKLISNAYAEVYEDLGNKTRDLIKNATSPNGKRSDEGKGGSNRNNVWVTPDGSFYRADKDGYQLVNVLGNVIYDSIPSSEVDMLKRIGMVTATKLTSAGAQPVNSVIQRSTQNVSRSLKNLWSTVSNIFHKGTSILGRVLHSQTPTSVPTSTTYTTNTTYNTAPTTGTTTTDTSGGYGSGFTKKDVAKIRRFGGGFGRAFRRLIEPKGRLKNAIPHGGRATENLNYLSTVVTLKKKIAAKKLGYSQSGWISDIKINGRNMRVRRDCTGFVSAAVYYATGCSAMKGCPASGSWVGGSLTKSLAKVGFRRKSWPGWGKLERGDILCRSGHCEIFWGPGHKVMNCGSDKSCNKAGPVNSAKSSYSCIYRPENPGTAITVSDDATTDTTQNTNTAATTTTTVTPTTTTVPNVEKDTSSIISKIANAYNEASSAVGEYALTGRKNSSEMKERISQHLTSRGASGRGPNAPRSGGKGGGFGGYGPDGFTYYSQHDPRWENTSYNMGQDDATMGNTGCGPTAMAMVASKLTGQDIEPTQAASLAKAGGYRDETGTNWNYMSNAANSYGLNSTEMRNPSTGFVASQLASGKPMILSGGGNGNELPAPPRRPLSDTNTGGGYGSPFGSNEHYVVATGLNSDGTVNVLDPEGKQTSGRYDINDITSDTNAAWSFDNGGGMGRGYNPYKHNHDIFSDTSHAVGGGFGIGPKGRLESALAKKRGGGYGLAPSCQNFVNRLYEIHHFIKAHGNKVYYGWGGPTSWGEFKRRIENGKSASLVCLVPHSWVLKDMGLRKGSKWWIGRDGPNGGFSNRDYCAAMKPYFTLIRKGSPIGKNIHTAALKGLLKAGDIICVDEGNHQHSFVYTGKEDLMFDGSQHHYGRTYKKNGIICHYSSGRGNILNIMRWKDSADVSAIQSTGTGTTAVKTATSYPKYPLTSSQIKEVATLVTGETGGDNMHESLDEASQIANLNELTKFSKQAGHTKNPKVSELLKTAHSKWYAADSWTRGVTSTAKKAVKQAIVEGKRTLPRYVTEHDTFSSGELLNKKAKRSDYKFGETVRNTHSAVYQFYKFFGQPDIQTGDIGGYKKNDYKKYKSDVAWNVAGTGGENGEAAAADAGVTATGDAAGATTTTVQEKTTPLDYLSSAFSNAGTAIANAALTDGKLDHTLFEYNGPGGTSDSSSTTNTDATTNTDTSESGNKSKEKKLTAKSGSYLDLTKKQAEKIYGKISSIHAVNNASKWKPKTYAGMVKSKAISDSGAVSLTLQKAGLLKSGKLLGHTGPGKGHGKDAIVGLKNLQKGTYSIHTPKKPYKNLSDKLKTPGAVYVQDNNIEIAAGTGKFYSANDKGKTYGLNAQVLKDDKGYSGTSPIEAVILPDPTKGPAAKLGSKLTNESATQAKKNTKIADNKNNNNLTNGAAGGGFGSAKVTKTNFRDKLRANSIQAVNASNGQYDSQAVTKTVREYMRGSNNNNDINGIDAKTLKTVINLLGQIANNTEMTSGKLDWLKNASGNTTIVQGGGKGGNTTYNNLAAQRNVKESRNEQVAKRLAMGK